MGEHSDFVTEIVDLNQTGEGIGRHEGMTYFIARAVPGDVVECRILEKKKRFGYAEVVRWIKSSSFRVAPPCPHFDVCGGCDLQMLSYETQINVKTQWVRDALKRIGGFDDDVIAKVLPVLGMPHLFRYRNKGTYQVSTDGEKIGFYVRRSHDVVEAKDCLIQDGRFAAVIQTIKSFLPEFKTHLRQVVLRKSDVTGQVMVVLIADCGRFPEEKALISALRETDSRIVSVIQQSPVLEAPFEVLFGASCLYDEIDGLRFKISPFSFYQVNPDQTFQLYKTAVDYAGLSGNETVFDVYCGTGTLSLFLARHSGHVYGIEAYSPAIADAWENAANNGIHNVTFVDGKAETVMPRLYKEGAKADVIVLDPPRSGCEKPVLDTILAMAPKRVVYVSCKPSTLARDLKVLCAEGVYRIDAVQPVDMFGMTGHVETVVLMSRVKVNTLF